MPQGMNKKKAGKSNEDISEIYYVKRDDLKVIEKDKVIKKGLLGPWIWKRELHSIARSLSKKEISWFFSTGLVIVPNEIAAIVKDGIVVEIVENGKVSVGGLLKLDSYFKDIEVVMMDTSQKDSGWQVEGLLTKDRSLISATGLLRYRIVDPMKFLTNCVYAYASPDEEGERFLSLQDINEIIKSEVLTRVLQPEVSKMETHDIYGNVDFQRKIEDELELRLKQTLDALGLEMLKLTLQQLSKRDIQQDTDVSTEDFAETVTTNNALDMAKDDKSTVLPKRNIPQDITVSSEGFGDTVTIKDALEIVKDGDKITVLPGIYKETLYIEKNVDISGYDLPDKVIIESSDVFCIQSTASNTSLRNLTIRQKNDEIGNCCAIDISSGKLQMHHCKIFSASLLGIFVNGAASPIIDGCEIQSDKEGAGIWIHGNSSLIIRESRIHDLDTGILITSSGEIRIENNIICSTAIGVRIDEDSHPTLKKNIIHNTKIGIFVNERGNGNIEENDISHAGKSIEICSGANPTIMRNNLHGGVEGSIGVCIHKNGGGLIDKNNLLGCEFPSYIQASARPRIGENTINGNLRGGAL